MDGEAVQTFETLDALVAFRIDTAGSHTLEMRYLPDIYILGWTASSVGLGIFVLLCTTEWIIKKRRHGQPIFDAIDEPWLTNSDEDTKEITTHTENSSNETHGGT